LDEAFSFFLTTDFGFRELALPFAMFSVLILLTHYASIFLLIVLWSLLICRHRAEFNRVVKASLLTLAGFAWWLPGFRSQIIRETASEIFHVSTGIIVPFTLFHFLTGDRGLSIGTLRPIVHHVPSIIAFVTIVGIVIHRFRTGLWNENRFRSILLITLIPILLNWWATFLIPRVFDATYYAVYSLPACIVLVAMVFHRGDSRLKPINLLGMVTLLGINLYTFTGFYAHKIAPFEPWEDALSFVREVQPDKIYLFPQYMQVLPRFYAPDLKIKSLTWRQSRAVLQTLSRPEQTRNESVVLILSHSKERGAKILRRFRQHLFLEQAINDRYYKIQIFLFQTSGAGESPSLSSKRSLL
jgi:hypothetical protein